MPDPVSAPANIALAELADFRRVMTGPGTGPRRILLALRAPTGESVTVDLWAMDEPQAVLGTPDNELVPPADRVFHLFATGVVCAGRALVEVTAAVPYGGLVYARRTADSLTVPRALAISMAP